MELCVFLCVSFSYNFSGIGHGADSQEQIMMSNIPHNFYALFIWLIFIVITLLSKITEHTRMHTLHCLP